MKTFTYSYPASSSYSEERDEYDETMASFDYEVDTDKMREAIANIIFNDDFSLTFSNDEDLKKKIIKALTSMISNFDLQEKLEKDLEDDLKLYFRDMAMNSFND